jgi:hypothetical protein
MDMSSTDILNALATAAWPPFARGITASGLDRELATDAGVVAARESTRAAGITWTLATTQSAESDRARLARLQQRPGASGRRFAELFPGQISNNGWRSSEEFIRCIHAGLNDRRMRAAISVGENDPSGGFSVPTEYGARWLDAALEDDIVRPRAQIAPMKSKTQQWISFDNSDHGDSILGFQGAWLPESGDITTEVTQVQAMTLVAHKVAILSRASGGHQLFDGRSLFYRRGHRSTVGNTHAGATVTVSKETGQAAGSILYENLAKMFARVHPRSQQRAVWVASNSAIPQLLQLSVPIGTSGSHVPVMTESNGEFRILTAGEVHGEGAGARQPWRYRIVRLLAVCRRYQAGHEP